MMLSMCQLRKKNNMGVLWQQKRLHIKKTKHRITEDGLENGSFITL